MKKIQEPPSSHNFQVKKRAALDSTFAVAIINHIECRWLFTAMAKKSKRCNIKLWNKHPKKIYKLTILPLARADGRTRRGSGQREEAGQEDGCKQEEIHPSIAATPWKWPKERLLQASPLTLTTAKECHCKRSVTVTGIFSVRRSLFGPNKCHSNRNVTVTGVTVTGVTVSWEACVPISNLTVARMSVIMCVFPLLHKRLKECKK